MKEGKGKRGFRILRYIGDIINSMVKERFNMSIKLFNKQNIRFFLSVIFMFIVSSGFALTADKSDEFKQILTGYTTSISQIDNYLDKGIISQERIDLFNQKLKTIKTKIHKVRAEAQDILTQQEALLSVLGPAPKKDEAPEDPATKSKRDEIQETVITYQGIVKLADSLLFQIKKAQDTLAKISLRNKAKGLFIKQEPLYDLQVWAFAWSDKNLAIQSFIEAYKKEFSDLVNGEKIKYPWVLIYYFVLAFYFIFPLSAFLFRHYGIRRKDAMPGAFRKVFTGIIQLLTKAILPLISVWLLAVSLWVTDNINSETWLLLNATFITVSIVIISYFVATITLSTTKPNWMILPLRLKSALSLKHNFFIFMFLVALNWYVTHLFSLGIFNIDFYLVLDFILRLVACISGLMLLRHKNWNIDADKLTDEFVYANWIKTIIKYLSTIVFITNPIFIFFGYLQLANSIFLSFIQVLLLIIFLFSAHYIAKELLGRAFFGKDKIPKIDEKTTKVTTKIALHYWCMLTLDVLFFLAGLFFILISVGIEKELIFRYISPIFSGIQIGHYVFSLKILFLSFLTFSFLYLFTKLVQTTLRKQILPHTSITMAAKQALVQGTGYVGIIIAVIAALLALGVSFTNLAIIAGALSVGIGFGLQNIVSNFISGVIMLIERPIKVGDRIVIGQDEGIVKRISVRATEIEDFQKSSILIPNSELVSGRLQNWTFDTPVNRLSVNVGVAYGTDVKKVEQLLLEVAKENSNVVSNPEPRVYFEDFGDSALIFRLLVYLYDIGKRNRTPSHLRFAIEEKFRLNGITIPFPQRDVHIKEK